MDTFVVDTLEEAGIDTSVDDCLPAVGIGLREDDQLLQPGESVALLEPR